MASETGLRQNLMMDYLRDGCINAALAYVWQLDIISPFLFLFCLHLHQPGVAVGIHIPHSDIAGISQHLVTAQLAFNLLCTCLCPKP